MGYVVGGSGIPPKGAGSSQAPHFESTPRAKPLARFLRFFGEKSEEVGFEPTKHFRVYTLSKRAPSATRTLLQKQGGKATPLLIK
jgi:hypothetical protein